MTTADVSKILERLTRIETLLEIRETHEQRISNLEALKNRAVGALGLLALLNVALGIVVAVQRL